MQISITNGTLASISETLSPSSGYSLPTTITVSGATSNYFSLTGGTTLTNLTGTVSITASAVRDPDMTYDLDSLNLSPGTYTIGVKAEAEGFADSNMSNTVTYVVAPTYPSKGDIINIDMTGSGTPQQYRVLKNVSNGVYEVLSMADVSTSIAFDSGKTKTYAGKTLDTYLNSTWYNTLSTTAKNALVSKTFRQDIWSQDTSGNPDYQGVYNGDTTYQISLSNASYGNSITRNIYALSVQDIIDYLGVTTEMTTANTTLTYTNIWQMFWNDTSSNEQHIWLRSAYIGYDFGAFRVNGNLGNVNDYFTQTSLRSRAAFQIDLSKISWS